MRLKRAWTPADGAVLSLESPPQAGDKARSGLKMADGGGFGPNPGFARLPAPGPGAGSSLEPRPGQGSGGAFEVKLPAKEGRAGHSSLRLEAPGR